MNLLPTFPRLGEDIGRLGARRLSGRSMLHEQHAVYICFFTSSCIVLSLSMLKLVANGSSAKLWTEPRLMVAAFALLLLMQRVFTCLLLHLTTHGHRQVLENTGVD